MLQPFHLHNWDEFAVAGCETVRTFADSEEGNRSNCYGLLTCYDAIHRFFEQCLKHRHEPIPTTARPGLQKATAVPLHKFSPSPGRSEPLECSITPRAASALAQLRACAAKILFHTNGAIRKAARSLFCGASKRSAKTCAGVLAAALGLAAFAGTIKAAAMPAATLQTSRGFSQGTAILLTF